jgi:predicted  nucleic acid-binding Zn ribbon protein
MDGIWFASGELEIAAHEQLASPQSTLARHGRELGRKVEQALGVPTYYFLMRYYGRGDAEQKRRCPGCNGEWRIKEPFQRASGLSPFHFRCENCRLIWA